MAFKLDRFKLPDRKKLLVWSGYAVFFSVCFFLFAYLTFPYDRVRDYIIQEVERPAGPDGRRRPSGVELDIVSLSPSWFTGVTLTGVRFAKQPDEPDGTPMEILLDEATVRASLLSALAGETDVSFDAEVGGGSIEGSFAQSEERTHVDAEFEQVELRQLGVFRSLVGLPFSGKLDGVVDLTVAQEAAETAGNIDLTVANLHIGGGQVPIPGMSSGLTVDRIAAGTLELEAEVDEGIARIQKLQSDGEDLRIGGQGTINLAQPLEMSRLDMSLKVNFSESYRQRSEHTERLFNMMDFVPDLRAAKTPDEGLQWRISGTFGGRIQATPAGGAR